MRDRHLNPALFKPDRVISREPLATPEELAGSDEGTLQEGAALFTSDGRIAVTLSPLLLDLSQFDALVLEARNDSETDLLAGVKLTHGTETLRKDLPDLSLSGGREPLDRNRWTEMRFPRECFGVYGKPRGWSDIVGMELFFVREKADTSRGDLSVALRGIEAQSREIPSGPRLTLDGLKGSLLQDVPGVTSFFGGSAGPSDPSPDLKSALGAYDMSNSGILIPAPHHYAKERAREILRGHIMGQELPFPIPWDFNPTGELEWTHFLNRHHFLRGLVRECGHSGPEQAEALAHMLDNWIESNPVPVDSNGGAGASWETLTAAWRLREWLWIAGIAWSWPHFPTRTKQKTLRSVWEHAVTLMDHQGHPNNWIMVEAAALTLAGLCFPWFSDAESWVATGIDRLRSQIHKQFFPDGVHFELSPLYHAICIQALAEVKLAAQYLSKPLPDEFSMVVERGFDYLAALRRPDGSWPSINDSGGTDGDYSQLIRWAEESFGYEKSPESSNPGVSTSGAPSRPEARTTIFQDAGIVIMRSDDSPSANWLVFRAGPQGATHAHEDTLSVDVSAFGRPVLVDPGVTRYAPDPLSDHYRSALAHNAILLDGKRLDRTRSTMLDRTRPAGGDLRIASAHHLNAAVGAKRVADPYGDLRLNRAVVFVDGRYWVVWDSLAGLGVHEMTVCWQFYPGRVESDLKTLTARFLDGTGFGFELVPLLGRHSADAEIYTGATHPPRGWVSVGGTDLPASKFIYHVKAQLPLAIGWILLPYRGGPTSGVKFAQTSESSDAFGVEMEFPDGTVERLAIQDKGGGNPPCAEESGAIGIGVEKVGPGGKNPEASWMEV